LQARCWPSWPVPTTLPRDNPVDPQLTPPVELQVALDDTAGAATLTWTPYEGEAPFAAYWVLRNELESTWVETLEVVTRIDRTAHVDSLLKPQTPYVYRVSTTNTAGFEVSSEPRTTRDLQLVPVEILRADFDAPTATCSLAWTPYQGLRFGAYEVWRSHATTSELRHTLSSRTATAFVDTGLNGNTEYSYTVRTVTPAGDAVSSTPATGLVHGVEVVWPLGLEPEERVRLSHDGDGQITAAATWVEGGRFPARTWARMYSLDRNSGPSPADTLSYPHTLYHRTDYPPGMATQIVAPGTRWTALVGVLHGHWRLRLYSSDRQSSIRGVLHPDVLAGEPEIVVPARYSEVETVAVVWAWTEGVRLHTIAAYEDGESIYFHDFAQGPPPDWDSWRVRDAGRDLVDAEEVVEFAGDALVLGSWISAEIALDVPGFRSDSITLEVEMSGAGAVQLGTKEDDTADPPYCYMWAITDTKLGEAPVWVFGMDPKSDSSGEERSWTYQYYASFPNYFTPTGRYAVSLGMDSGTVTATVPGHFPDVLWSAPDTPEEPLGLFDTPDDPLSPWISLAAVEQGFALLSIGDRLYSISPDGDARKAFISPLEGDVAELRVWADTAEEGMYHVGLCVPDRHSIYVDRARAPSSRSRSVTVMSNTRWSLSEAAGPDPGSFLFPLSFAIGPNGRIYVLDAGNHRIQVFGPDGEYITQWGRCGSGPGDFDFGQGMTSLDFRGSIAVDDEGYIFVADPGNQRIQVFYP